MRDNYILLLILSMIIAFAFCACGDGTVYTPKPRGFPKIDFPTREYQEFAASDCPMKFEYPVYAKAQRDTLYFQEKHNNPCWFDLYTPHFDTRLHCSYYEIGKANSLEKLRNDAFKLAGKHNSKANYIDELPIQKENNVNGFVFDIDGPVASPFQFYLTDNSKHFVRGSLYFNTQSRPDSLAPIYDFMKEDIMHLINTLEWVD